MKRRLDVLSRYPDPLSDVEAGGGIAITGDAKSVAWLAPERWRVAADVSCVRRLNDEIHLAAPENAAADVVDSLNDLPRGHSLTFRTPMKTVIPQLVRS